MWAAVVLCACSANDVSDPETGPIDCAEDECSGSYLARFSQIGGDCAPMDDSVTDMDGLDDFGGCTHAEPPGLSPDACQVDVDLVCPRDDGRTVTIVGAIEQTDDICDHVIATATFRLYETDGMLLCSGTYRISYERL
jgi:hypothetical protein